MNPETQGGHRTGCTEGARLGQEAMDEISLRSPGDARKVDAVIERFAASGREWSLNDMRPYLKDISARNVIGARINAASRSGRIRDTRKRVRSTDPGTHGHEIRVWIGRT